ncbi:MAG: hypothetical protein KKC20_16375 [Proteobacteria bacterium]|nr:hypothetical protein [Pseudomonadota bacterium]
MYKEYFLMQTEPFAPFPSPSLFYKSRGHEKAWKSLLYCLQNKEPVVMTAGEYGTGKTLLGLKLIRFMEKKWAYPMVYIPSPGYSFPMVLEKIARELGLPIDPSNEKECQRFIYEYFENDPPEKNKYIYIVVDDIQEFDHTFVSDLTKLITYNNYGYFPIKLFMFGHTSFLQSLDKRNLISFKQRIKTIPLSSLNLEEVTEYIYFRLISSGASGSPVFDEPAIELITHASKGLPRLINKVCDASLVLACKKRANFIDRKIVEQALDETGIVPIQTAPGMMETQSVPKTQRELPPPRKAVVPVEAHPEMQPERPPQRRKDLFSLHEKQMPGATRKNQKPQDLKPHSLVDGKSLVIVCLVIIIVVMLLFFFREARLSAVSSLGGEKNLGSCAIVMKSILRDANTENVSVVMKQISRMDTESFGDPMRPLVEDLNHVPADGSGMQLDQGNPPVLYQAVKTQAIKKNG